MKTKSSYCSNRKMYNCWLKYVVIYMSILSTVGLIIVYFYFQSIDPKILNEPTVVWDHMETSTYQGKRYVHLDLKGAPPKVSYYRYLFSIFAEVGIRGILIEYEDMFPFKGNSFNNLSALNAYSVGDIKVINNLAQENNLEIIPLVPVFGELEFALKLDEFKHLREIPELPQVVCPSNVESMELITEMVMQVIEAHPNLRAIHIGGGEILYLGRCKKCKEKINSLKISKEDLYLQHIKMLCNFIRHKYPKMSILIWDDQLRYLLDEESQNRFHDFNIIPVVKQFDSDVFDKLGSPLWNEYAKYFTKIWIASAFKGATGVDDYIVNVAHYMQNHRSWMSVIDNYKYSVNFSAIIITGLQRYNHFSTLCELLPVALPSLVMNLKILESKDINHLEASKQVGKIFKCQQAYALMGPSLGTPRCSFPGSEILENVYRLHQLIDDFKQIAQSLEVKGWMSSFNSHYGFSSPEHVMRVATQLNHFEKEINEIENDMSRALLDVYDAFTKNEWIFTYILPLKRQISELQRTKAKCLSKNIWPRKPFNNRILEN
ncbi:hypothetical protein WA026_008445 [Henosepilachna vigintioctopunctata]|uniref:Beta-N-acetylhexosaminidase n=1 Tax=Henosepilachna vigintioctopunctata TaxID=420089 RepID=A0AAW1UGK7_9CUCU